MAGKRRDDRYRRRRKKRRGFRGLFTFLTFCIIAGAIITSVTVFLKVSKIEVSGAKRYKSENIIATSGIKTGDNLFAINKFDISSQILKKYPYIESIRIRRKLPDTFVFEVTERIPCGYIDMKDQRWIVDKGGYLLERVPIKTETKFSKILAGEPLLAPTVGSKVTWKEPEKVNALTAMLEQLVFGDMVTKVGQIDVSKLFSISFTYENRFRVVLGSSEDMEKKFKMFRAVLKELSANDRGTINLSSTKQARFTPNAAIKFS